MSLLTHTAVLLSACLAGMSQVPPDKPSEKPLIKLEFRRAETVPREGLIEMIEPGTTRKVYLHKTADVTNEDIAEAKRGKNADGNPVVEVIFSKAGGKKMGDMTEKQFKKPLAILINGKLVGAPVVYSRISERAIIDGRFTEEERDKLVTDINGK